METIFLIVRHSFAQSQIITATSVFIYFRKGKIKLVARTFDPFGLARRWQPFSLLLNTALPWIKTLQPPTWANDLEFQPGCMNIRPLGLARRWKPFSLLFTTQLCHGSDCYSHHVGGVIFLVLFIFLGLTSLLSEHSSDLVELGDGNHFPYC